MGVFPTLPLVPTGRGYFMSLVRSSAEAEAARAFRGWVRAEIAAWICDLARATTAR